MDITTLILINWILSGGIFSELNLITLTLIRRLNKNIFYWLILLIISILWISAFVISVFASTNTIPLAVMPPY